jgi:predicted O-methyltransferase YrrM
VELITINKIVKAFSPKRLFEIGTFDGRTTLNLAVNSKKTAKVYTIDLPKKENPKTSLPLYEGKEASDFVYIKMKETGKRFMKSELRHKVVQLYGDSAKFDFKPFYKSMDFVFVDGSHSKYYVENDTEVAMKLLKPNGIIMWHDYGIWKDVTETLDSFFKKDNRFRKAVKIENTCFVFLSR